MAGIISDSPSMKAPDVGSSSKLQTNVGSGSRPTRGSTTTPTSAPENQRTLDRDPPAGALK